MKKNRIVLFYTFVFGFLAYMFFFTNLLLNHDSVSKDVATGATIVTGRWGIYFLSLICPPYLMPWFIGVVSLVFISTANCLVIKLFEIRELGFQILISGLIVTFPSFIVMYCYIQTAIYYSLSFLLTILSICCFYKGGNKNYCLFIVFVILSFSLYQGYLTILLSLILLLFIKSVIVGDKDILWGVKKFVIFLFLFIVASVMYMGLTELFLFIYNESLNSYAEERLTSENSWLANIINIYWHFKLYFVTKFKGLINTTFSQWLHWGVVALIVVGLLRSLNKLRFKKRLLLLIALLAYPFTVNIFEFISPNGIYAMLLSGFLSLYIFTWLLYEYTLKSKKVRNFLILLYAGIIMNNVFIANKVGLRLYLSYQNAFSYYTSIVSNIHLHPDFTPDTEIAIVGTPYIYIYDFPNFAYDGLYYLTDLVRAYSRDFMIQTKLGFNAPFITEDSVLNEIRKDERFVQMTCYPYNGSIKKIDDILVIKLSN